MQRTFIALACTLALAGGTAFAQQDKPGQTPSATDSQTSGDSITERAKETAKKVGEKSKDAAVKAQHKTAETASKAKDKTEEKAHEAKADSDQKAAQARSGQDTQSMGASGSSSEDERQKRMDQAYRDSQKSGQSSSATDTTNK